MNTGLLRYAVATVLTVYGIETRQYVRNLINNLRWLQQCLPFTVLKRNSYLIISTISVVATVLTVYGIETLHRRFRERGKIYLQLQQCLPFTVLKPQFELEKQPFR